MASAADVPGKFDVVINGQGYIFDSSFDPSVVYKSQKATYGYTPTFVERQNVSGDYGDNQQDFWMVESQRTFTGGAGRRYFRASDSTASTQFYESSALDISIDGEISVTNAVSGATLASAYRAACASQSTLYHAAADSHLYSDVTTDLGAHGLGTATVGDIAYDGNVYLTSTSAGSVGVRLYNGAFSTFSATIADKLAFNNNTLYGYRNSTGEFYTYSSAGVAATSFTFKKADGTASNVPFCVRLLPFGGKIVVLLSNGELWQWDGSAMSILARFPPAFNPSEMVQAFGSLYIVGSERGGTSFATTRRAALWKYSGTAISQEWRSRSVDNSHNAEPSLTVYKNGLVLTDSIGGPETTTTFTALRFFDPATSAMSSLGSTGGSSQYALFATQKTLFVFRASNTSVLSFGDESSAASGYLYTSLYDFDSSLPKYVKSVRIDGDFGTGSVDIGYQLNGVSDNGWVSLQTGAVAGTEYLINLSARSVSIRLTVNGNAKVRRVYVRAAPLQETFRTANYILDCTGNKNNPTGPGLIALRDGTRHSKDGQDMATDLVTAVTASAPITITDRLGTFTGVIEPAQFELHEVRSNYGRGEFRALVSVRQT